MGILEGLASLLVNFIWTGNNLMLVPLLGMDSFSAA